MHLLSFLSNDSQYLQFTFRTSHLTTGLQNNFDANPPAPCGGHQAAKRPLVDPMKSVESQPLFFY